MGRRKTSPAEDLIELVSLMPWWLGVALAVISYPLLHQFATQQVVATSPQLLTIVWLKAVATVGQYLVPFVCLLGAFASFLRRRQRESLLANATGSKSAAALNGMSWREFEMLVGEMFRARGYGVTETGGQGADGGVDLVLSKGGEGFLVQCKQWKAFRVGVDVVRELYGVMAAKGVAGGFVITSGRFTDEAIAFADGRNLELIDGNKLDGWIKSIRSRKAEPMKQEAAEPTKRLSATDCPLCGKEMARRVAKQGPNRGNAFWGCTGYPRCRGTRPIQ